MRLTRAGEYAVRCMLYLCDKGQGNLVSRQEIAESADIPAHFLAKIAQQLAKAGFIEIRQGARGGFILSKKPSDISLLQVVETMIGEIYLNDCIIRPESCGSQPECSVHRVWLNARDQLRSTLAAVSLADLQQGTICQTKPLIPGQLPQASTSCASDAAATQKLPHPSKA
ncbi:MAG: Rrf2 family transcriptional regulator [Desulfobulbaceae bacterium]|nr:Rrf2 family transcriptional regulator [Desulfobulbaceae bacterium]